MVVQLYIDNDKLDLFKDENIQITSSITDANDVTKNSGDYSKSFTVPATENNNRIFKHYYDATIDNTFDARTKVNGHIYLDGLPFKNGKWRLTKVAVKHGIPSSYTINFFGKLVSLKDKFKKDELKDLDLSHLDHSYNSTVVKDGLQNGLYNNKIVYNLLTKRRYYYSSDPNDNTVLEDRVNIGWNGSQAGIQWNDLQPSIKLIEIIKAIESKYTIKFSRDFFGRVEFDNLYMWLNRDKDSKAGGGTQRIRWDNGDSTFINFSTGVGIYSPCTQCNPRLGYKLTLVVNPSSGYGNIPYKIIQYINGEESSVIDASNQGIMYADITSENTQQFNVHYEIRCDQEFKYTSQLSQLKIELTHNNPPDYTYTNYNTYATENTIASFANIKELTPNIKVIDFLKGLFQMFKLVVIPLNDTDVYINNLNDYYSEGKLFDITQYVDFDSYDVERGDILNEINFKFSEPQTILNQEFEKRYGIAYGDEELALEDDNGDPLDGGSLDLELPFEQVIYERLTDAYDNELTDTMVGSIISEDLKPVSLKPHIFYNVRQNLGSKVLGYRDANSVTQVSGIINTASHTIDFNQMLYSAIFSAEFSTWDGRKIDNTLYWNYYKDYILSIFNVKRRNFKYRAILPLHILTSLQLNDVLKIKGNYYRIDKYTINLLTGEADLNLINSFDNDLSQFETNNTVFFEDYNSNRMSVYIRNTEGFKTKFEDVGYGVGWITVSADGNNIIIDITENNTGAFRRAVLVVFLGGREIRISINQEAKPITIDSTLITVDNNIITADNV